VDWSLPGPAERLCRFQGYARGALKNRLGCAMREDRERDAACSAAQCHRRRAREKAARSSVRPPAAPARPPRTDALRPA